MGTPDSQYGTARYETGGLHLKNTARAQRMLKENEEEISKKRKMAKNDFSRSDLGS